MTILDVLISNKELAAIGFNALGLFFVALQMHRARADRSLQAALALFEFVDRQWYRYFDRQAEDSSCNDLTESQKFRGQFIFAQLLSAVELTCLALNRKMADDRVLKFYNHYAIGVLNNFGQDEDFLLTLQSFIDHPDTLSEVREFVSQQSAKIPSASKLQTALRYQKETPKTSD